MLVAEGDGGEGEGKQLGTWRMKSYTYQGEHGSIHVLNVHNTVHTNMTWIEDKVGREHSSIAPLPDAFRNTKVRNTTTYSSLHLFTWHEKSNEKVERNGGVFCCQ